MEWNARGQGRTVTAAITVVKGRDQHSMIDLGWGEGEGAGSDFLPHLSGAGETEIPSSLRSKLLATVNADSRMHGELDDAGSAGQSGPSRLLSRRLPIAFMAIGEIVTIWSAAFERHPVKALQAPRIVAADVELIAARGTIVGGTAILRSLGLAKESNAVGSGHS